MSKLSRFFVVLALLLTALVPAAPSFAQDDGSFPPAKIENDEGGPVVIDGEMNYTNPETFSNVAQPLVILEDEAGFVTRDRGFVIPKESQVLGVITSDFFSPPVSYTISLPEEPQATLRDVDQDGVEDKGVMVYALAFWSNAFGDSYLEPRDLSGAAWSTDFASMRVKTNPSGGGEVIGGTYVVWAPDDQQGFPSGFGEDGKLFTADDPIVQLPAGYTVVNMDTDPFTFDRSSRPTINLIESEESALEDYSKLSYTEAFDKMLELFRQRYAFTELKSIDWDEMAAEFRPQFEAAEQNNDVDAYRRALREFMLSIPDAHIAAPTIREDFQKLASGGYGMAIRELDNGDIAVTFVTPDGPADQAGIQVGAQILEMDGQPAGEFVANVQPYSGPFGTEHTRHLQQLRYATRAPLDTELEVTYQNPDGAETSATLTAAAEDASFRFSSFNRGLTGAELPVEFEVRDDGIAYAKLNSFFDNELLTVQLWEQMMRSLNALGIQALILDLRQNGGGSGFLADQMAAYFFNDELVLNNTEFYDEELGKFLADPNLVQKFIPPDPALQFQGKVAVIVGPNCASACEFFTYDMTKQGRAEIVGQYPTAGAGGSRVLFLMPGPEALLLPVGRPIDAEGNVIIEGKGVAPTIRVPVTAETLLSSGDPLLEIAVAEIKDEALPYGAGATGATEGGSPTVGAETGTPVATETAAATEAATAEATEAPTAAATETEAATATEAATEAATATEVVTATTTATEMATETPTEAATATEAATEAATAEATETPAAAATEVITATPEATEAVTEEVTATETITLAAPPVATEAAAATQETGAGASVAVTTVTIATPGGRARVYAQPTTGSTILGSVADGSTWNILEISADGEWVRIDYGNADGAWVNVLNIKSE